jgi:glycosyltransferase involved in cell wall biosynthesis
MIIFHLIKSLEAGGLQHQLNLLASEQVKLGHKVHVIYIKDDYYVSKLTENGILLHHYPGWRLRKLLFVFFLYELIRKYSPSLIQSWSWQMDIFAGYITRFLSVPWVLQESNSVFRDLGPIANFIRKFAGRNASCIVANSLSGRFYWESSSYRNNINIIPNSFPYDKITEAKSGIEIKILKNIGKYILYVGRMNNRQKNISKLLEVFKDLVKSDDKISCIIVGFGQEKGIIDKNISFNKLSKRIITTGLLPHDVIWSLMVGASLLVSISNYEGCPNVVLEALACGCPVVLSDIPGHREFFEESIAWYVDSNSVKDTVKTIREVLGNTKLVKKKAVNGKRFISKWPSPYEIALKYEKIYHDVIL